MNKSMQALRKSDVCSGTDESKPGRPVTVVAISPNRLVTFVPSDNFIVTFHNNDKYQEVN